MISGPRTLKWLFASAWLPLMFLSGCGNSPPPIVPVTGVVLVDGEPLMHAQVKFVPLTDGLSGNLTASAVTDTDGKFELKVNGDQKAGCCACLCQVTVSEGPIPKELREAGQGSWQEIEQFREELTNRPIPGQYARLATTPLKYEVTEENSDFKIEITR